MTVKNEFCPHCGELLTKQDGDNYMCDVCNEIFILKPLPKGADCEETGPNLEEIRKGDGE